MRDQSIILEIEPYIDRMEAAEERAEAAEERAETEKEKKNDGRSTYGGGEREKNDS